MKRTLIKRGAAGAAALLLLLFGISTSRAVAQTPGEGPPPEAVQDQAQNWQGALGLSPDQVGKIRSILQEKRFERQAISQRLRQAQMALDDAVYSENATEAEIEQRAQEVAAAQAAQIHLRAMTELNIRRVLTPEQLNTFRRIRGERIRAQMGQGNGNDNRRALRNERLENSIQRKAGQNPDTPVRRNANPILTPRERRALFGRRIRP